MSDFETQVIIYLKNIREKVEKIETTLAEVGRTTVSLGKACGTAFKQCKTVIQSLGETVEESREDLSEYGGVILGSTWHSDNM